MQFQNLILILLQLIIRNNPFSTTGVWTAHLMIEATHHVLFLVCSSWSDVL